MKEFTSENRAILDGALQARVEGFKQGGNRLYKPVKASEERRAELSESIRTKSALLAKGAGNGAVDFSDLSDVQNRTIEYLEACARTSSYPSLSGLAVYGLGVDRKTLYNRFWLHPDAESTRYLSLVRDAIGDLMSDAALNRRADAVSVIFQLKNGFGFSDRLEIEPIRSDSEQTSYNADELRARYGGIENEDESIPEPPED